MSKVTLNDLSNLQNENTAVTKINQNSQIIEDAFDNTLSRDGSTPNQMNADLDMNSNDILNANSVTTKELTLNGVKVESSDLASLDKINTGEIFSNISGSDNTPTGNLLSDILDYAIGSEQGDLITRKASGWQKLLPGTNGQLLRANGSGSDLSWTDAGGVGDMLKSTYDPTNVNADAFNSANESFIQAGTGAIARSVQDKLREVVDLKDYATTFDGVEDNTDAFNKALTYAASIGGVLKLPLGIITLTSTITVPPRVSIVGEKMPVGWGSSTAVAVPQVTDGTWVYLKHTVIGFFINDVDLTAGAGTRLFSKFGTFRDQPDPDVGFSPNNHNYDFYIQNGNDIYFEDIHLLNASKGFFATQVYNGGPVIAGRLSFNRISGQPLHEGFNIAYAYDVIRINSIHFWPFWSLNENVYNYTTSSAYAFQIGRVDNPFLDQIFTFGYAVGFRFYHVPDGVGIMGGSCGNFSIGTLQCDFGGCAILTDLEADGVTGTINTMVAYGASTPVDPLPTAPVAFNLAANSCDIRIASLKCVLGQQYMMGVSGSGNLIRIGSLTSQLANQSGVGYAHLLIGSGNTVVLGPRPIIDSSGPVHIGGGTLDCTIGQGLEDATTDGSGAVTLTHNLPTLPGHIIVQVLNLNSDVWAYTTAITSSTFTVKAYSGTGSTVNDTALRFTWQAYA